MTKGIYIIRDTVAETAVGGPLVFPHHAVAVRFFGDVAKDPQSVINRYPKDHSLLYIGMFDEQTATITPVETTQVIITGEAWLAMQEQENA